MQDEMNATANLSAPCRLTVGQALDIAYLRDVPAPAAFIDAYDEEAAREELAALAEFERDLLREEGYAL